MGKTLFWQPWQHTAAAEAEEISIAHQGRMEVPEVGRAQVALQVTGRLDKEISEESAQLLVAAEEARVLPV
jgi:protein involved in polysaccharide export with SLBB domain